MLYVFDCMCIDQNWLSFSVGMFDCQAVVASINYAFAFGYYVKCVFYVVRGAFYTALDESSNPLTQWNIRNRSQMIGTRTLVRARSDFIVLIFFPLLMLIFSFLLFFVFSFNVFPWASRALVS